jgi:hypothetical protein
MPGRTLIERAALFGLGIVPVAVVALSSGEGLEPLVASLLLVAVVAGLVEASGARRTGQRHRVAAWLAPVLGSAAAVTFAFMAGPQGTDSGVALSIVVATFVVAAPAFAAVVLAVAAVALRVRPPGRPPG